MEGPPKAPQGGWWADRDPGLTFLLFAAGEEALHALRGARRALGDVVDRVQGLEPLTVWDEPVLHPWPDRLDEGAPTGEWRQTCLQPPCWRPRLNLPPERP